LKALKTSGGGRTPVRHTIPLGIVIFLVLSKFSKNTGLFNFGRWIDSFVRTNVWCRRLHRSGYVRWVRNAVPIRNPEGHFDHIADS